MVPGTCTVVYRYVTGSSCVMCHASAAPRHNIMVASRDPEAQKRGFVSVCYFLAQGNGSGLNKDAIWKYPKLFRCLPFRVAALHLCYYDNTLWRPVQALLKTSLNIVARIRIRTHYGELKCNEMGSSFL
jgi:hypothetical protein